MSKDKPNRLYWIGSYDADGQPLEYFGGVPGERDPIPARDLTPEDTAQLTEAQWAAIESDTGKRLYQKTEPKRERDDRAIVKPEPEPEPSPNSAAPSAESSSSGASS